jgi:hypothetical protein
MEVEFKLFGSLTVKQFISLAGGIVLAVLIYLIGLPLILSVPLIILTAGTGFAMAFITVNGQAFSRWIVNFVNAIISSQRYVWKKTPHAPQSLTKSVSTKKPGSDVNVRKKEFGLTPIIEVAQEKSIVLDTEEQKDLAELDKYFENEFGKQWSGKAQSAQSAQAQNSQSMGATRQGNIKRVNTGNMNIASDSGNLADDDVVVDVGDGNKAVYKSFTKRGQRPLVDNKDETTILIESKIKEILAKQKDLGPMLKTEEIEQNERKLKAQMRQLYHEIQQLKNKNS